MNRYVWITMLVFVLCIPTAGAEQPTATQTVEIQVDRLLNILQSDKTDSEILQTIREQFTDFFDFENMSRLALGHHWRNISPEERNRFENLYRELLETTYLDQVLAYEDEEVKFIDERILAENRTEVITQVVRNNNLIPVHYRLVQQDGRWRIYDLIIENVSLARNYRSQFAGFLERNSFDDLLEELRRKTKEEG